MAREEVQILLIEDEEAHAEAVKRAFRIADPPVNLKLASSLREALAHLEESTPDLVIADWLLPDGKGTDILQFDKEHLQFPVVLMTSHGNEQVAVDAMKAGAVDYVVKSPAIFAEMPRVAERVLREWNLLIENKRAQEALRASEERFRAIFMRAADHIFVVDREGKFLQVNPAFEALLGRAADQIVGRTVANVLGEKGRPFGPEICERVMQGESVEGERSLSIHGVPVTLSYSLSPLRDPERRVVGILGITRDVTDRKRIELSDRGGRSTTYPSRAIRVALDQAMMAAQKASTVLLLGESGAGKDWLARYIHEHSDRAGAPYLVLNCAAIAPNLAESELFGHEKGAFTGAVVRKRGMFELAEGGTLLLNEIGELPLELQAKLLAFLDSKKFTRVGGEKEISVHVRLMAATNRDLKKEVEQGRFRQDLYYRLNVIEINAPPLRERKEDIPLLSQEMLSQLAREMQLPSVPVFDSATTDALVRYRWPGNVRELKNVLERALILWDGQHFDISLPSHQDVGDEEKSMTMRFEGRTLQELTDDLTRSMCMYALQQSNGNKKQAAKLLGIARDTFYRYLKGFGIRDGDALDGR